jgi:hypothetical protein
MRFGNSPSSVFDEGGFVHFFPHIFGTHIIPLVPDALEQTQRRGRIMLAPQIGSRFRLQGDWAFVNFRKEPSPNRARRKDGKNNTTIVAIQNAVELNTNTVF